MVHSFQVLVLVLVIITSSVLSGDQGSLTTQTQQPKPTVNTQKGKVEVKPEYVDELNEMISRYLLTFETLKRRSTDRNSKSTMETIKLLIVQSWIKTLKPNPNLVTMDGTDLETLTREIKATLMKVNTKPEVEDDIVIYSTKLEPVISESFQTSRKHYESAEEIFNKHIEKAKSARNGIEADHIKSTWNGISIILNQVNVNLVLHRIAHRMYIQSYIENFIPQSERPKDKIALISLDKRTSKRFRVPSMEGMDIFSDILLGDPEEVDRIILNGRISRYLNVFEEEREKTSDKDLKDAMYVVKQLILQGWLENLTPDSAFFPPGDENLNKDDIKRSILQKNVDYNVKDAIILYTKEKEQEIENELKKKQDSLNKEYEKRNVEAGNVPTSQQASNLNRIEDEINELQDHLIAHRISKLFYLHSYQKNFAKESSDKLEITSPKGKASFDMHPIKLIDFYENPIFD